MKLKLGLAFLAFAILIGGAYIAYDQLAPKSEGSNLQFVENGELPSGGPESTTPSVSTPPTQTPPASGDSSVSTPPVQNTPSVTPPSDDSGEEEGTPNDFIQKPPEAELVPPPTAPTVQDFTVYDVNGKAVKLSDYFGKPIVLNFFASWCGPCRTEMPAFQAKYLELRSEIHFLFVSIDESFADAKKYVNLQGFSFPIFHDRNGSAASTYKVTSIPSSFFINKDGVLVAYAVGALSYASLETAISRIR